MNNKYSLAQLHAIYCVYRDLDPGTRTVNCCTCGRSLYIEQIEDCYNLYGHYIARSIEPKLKYHPLNAFPQCPQCNMNINSSIDILYDEYMNYRFGPKIKEELLNDNSYFTDLEYTKQYYINELIKLKTKFPELISVVLDKNTGEIFDVSDIEDYVEKQWYIYSKTYKQDLDRLTKLLRTEPIEYERL